MLVGNVPDEQTAFEVICNYLGRTREMQKGRVTAYPGHR